MVNSFLVCSYVFVQVNRQPRNDGALIRIKAVQKRQFRRLNFFRVIGPAAQNPLSPTVR